MALRKSDLDALVYPPGKSRNSAHFVADGAVPNLYVRVYPSGRKAFVLRYRDASGRQRVFTVGDYGHLTLTQGRELARRKMADVVGGDVLTRRRQSSAPTFERFAQKYDDLHLTNLRSARDTRTRMKRQVLRRWAKRRLDELTPPDLLRVRNELADKPYEFNRLLENLSSMYSRAREWGDLPHDFRSPTTDVKPNREKRRERVLTRDERERLIAEVKRLENDVTRIYLQVLMLLPFRMSELMRARWDGYDEKRGFLTVEALSDHKPTKPQPVPRQVAALLRELPRVDECPWIFPSSRTEGHIRSVNTAWRRVRERAGLEDVRIHDLRRTIATRVAEMGASAHAIRDLLGHERLDTALHYVHRAQDHNRALLEALAEEG